MKRVLLICLALVLLLSACAPQPGSPALTEWPTSGWKTVPPEAQGMDSELLASGLQEVLDSGVNLYSLVVVRGGAVVTEAYFDPFTAETPVHVQSVTKTVIGMLVGRAIAEGKIASEEELLYSFFPGRVTANLSPDKEAIRLSHLLSMSSGFDCQEFSPDGPKMEQSSGWVQFMLDLPVVHKPGTTFNYCNGNAHLLSAIIEKATGMQARMYANAELFAPLGIAPVEETDWPSDPKDYSIGGYGLRLRPADLAKLALLHLQDGQWDGQRLLPKGWAGKATAPYVTKEDGSSYGYLWTVYPEQKRYSALGLGGQQIHVYPEKDLIIITTAGLPAYTEAPEIERLIGEYILPAVKSDRPLPPNAAAFQRLQTAIAAAAHPEQPVAALPAAALDISGQPFTLAENPFGWQTMQMTFTPGAAEAQISLNGSAPIEIGLDHVYRRTEVQPLGVQHLRGRWIDAQTFEADYPYAMYGLHRLGELGETRMQFHFEGDRMEVTVTPLIFAGEPILVTGTR